MKNVKCPTCACTKFVVVLDGAPDENGMRQLGDLLDIKTQVLMDDGGNIVFADETAENPPDGRGLERIECGMLTCSGIWFSRDQLGDAIGTAEDTVTTSVWIKMRVTLEHRKAADLFNVLEDKNFTVKPKFPSGFKVLDATIEDADQVYGD